MESRTSVLETTWQLLQVKHKLYIGPGESTPRHLPKCHDDICYIGPAESTPRYLDTYLSPQLVSFCFIVS